MARKITGVISQFGSKGYGFIDGDDGQRYFVHQKNIDTKSRLTTDTRVVFNPQTSDKGLVAMKVKLEKSASLGSKPLTHGAIKVMFLVLFIIQIVVLYQLFLAA